MNMYTPKSTLFPYTTLFRSSLVGADLVIHSNRELSEAGQAIVDTVRQLSTDYSTEQRFASMVMFPNSGGTRDRKSTRLNSSHVKISYAVFCLKKKKIITI